MREIRRKSWLLLMLVAMLFSVSVVRATVKVNGAVVSQSPTSQQDSGYVYNAQLGTLTLYTGFPKHDSSGVITSDGTENLTIIVPANNTVTIDSCVHVKGALTFEGDGTLKIESDTISVIGNGITVRGNLTLNVTSTDTTAIISGVVTSTAITSYAGISISGTATVTVKSGTGVEDGHPDWLMIGGGISSGANTTLKLSDSLSIKSNGAVDLLGAVDSIWVVEATNAVTLGSKVVTADSAVITSSTGSIYFGARTGEKVRKLDAKTTLDIASSLAYADTLRSGTTLTVSRGIDSVVVLGGKDIRTTASVKADSISGLNSVSIGSSTNARVITSNGTDQNDLGNITISSTTNILNAVTGAGGGILAKGTVTINASVNADVADTAAIAGNIVKINTGTVKAKGGASSDGVDDIGIIAVGGELSVASGAKVIGSAVCAADAGTSVGYITWSGSSDTVSQIVSTGAGNITFTNTAKLNLGARVNNDTVTANIEANKNKIGSTNIKTTGSGSIIINGGTIYAGVVETTSSGSIQINGGKTFIGDSINSAGLFSLSGSATELTIQSDTVLVPITANTVSLTGGKLIATSIGSVKGVDHGDIYGILSTGDITIGGSVVLVNVDSIKSETGNITVSAPIKPADKLAGLVAESGEISVSSTGSGSLGVVSGGDVSILSAAVIGADSVIVKNETNTLSVSGKLTVAKNIELLGALNLASSGTLTLSSDDLLGASSIYIAGTLAGVTVDSIGSSNGTIEIVGSTVKAGKIGSSKSLSVTNGASLTLTAAPTATLASITAPDGLFINGRNADGSKSSTVETSATGELLDVAEYTRVYVTNYGILRRAGSGGAVKLGEDKLEEVDGSATVIIRPEYPRHVSNDVTFAKNLLTIEIIADSVSSAESWKVYLLNQYGYYQHYIGTAQSLTESETTPGKGDVIKIGPIDGAYYLNKDGNGNGTIAIVTERGVARFTIDNPTPSVEVVRDGDDGITHTPSNPWYAAEANAGWNSSVDYNYPTAWYSNETLKVTFVFGKTATKNETIVFSGLYKLKTNSDGSYSYVLDNEDKPISQVRDYLTYDTDILPVGANSVPVTFSFRNGVNPSLRSELVTRALGDVRGEITASIKGDEEKGEFGSATTTTVVLYDSLMQGASFVPPSVGSTGSASLNLAGGTGQTQYKIVREKSDGTIDVLVPWSNAYDIKDSDGKVIYPGFEKALTQARLELLFGEGIAIYLKEPNTGDKAYTLRIVGPNAGGSTGGNTDPSVSHSIVLSTSPYLITTPGLYPSRDQTFAFDISLPEGTDADATEVILTIIRVVNGLESAPVEVKPKTTKNTDGTLKIHVSDITTDIKITGITLRAATGTESIVSTSVWSSSRQLTITAAANGIAKIYSLRGGLVSEFSYGVGSTSITLPVGLYIVTLSDGSITKVIIK